MPERETADQDHSLGVLDRQLMTIRIIVGSLMGGLTFFLGIATYLGGSGGNAPPGGTPLITWIAVLFSGVALVMHVFIPKLIVQSSLQSLASGESPPPAPNTIDADLAELGPAGRVLAIFQTKTIIAAALLEGAGFFNGVAYIIEGQWISPVIAAVMLVAIGRLFPTKLSLTAWVNEHLRKVESMRGG